MRISDWSSDVCSSDLNAILRVRAFAESCGLPELSGKEPMGGHIMSHDMVEAALLRRRGWGVHMANLPTGSHEEFPPTLTDLAVRDRRWRSEEHTSELQSLMRISYAVFCLKKKKHNT